MEITLGAKVVSEPRFFTGTHGRHETFGVVCNDGSALAGTRLDIIDNVDIAQPVPVHRGDQIEVRGEMVHDPQRRPIIHWTHHDPGGRHPDGYITFGGVRYA